MNAAIETSPVSSDDTRPVVPVPRAGLSAAVIVAVCAIVAISLFAVLENARRARATASEHSITMESAITSPAPFQLPMPSPRPVQPDDRALAGPRLEAKPQSPMPWLNRSIPQGSPLMPDNSPAAFPQAPPAPVAATVTVASRAEEALDDPVLILDTGVESATISGAKPQDEHDALASDDSAVKATRIQGRTMLVPQGTIINAVLETPIDSTRPGLVRAVVSRDAFGFDGTKVLIPRGSRLIGQVEGDAKPGQHRIFVEWSRLIRPDGVAIRIGSPASDTLGGSGITGRVNNHFFARFANAALQSALTAGVAIASRSSNSPYIYALPGPIAGAGQSLFPDVPPGATIKVRAGAAIAVFVARDLDFSGTSGR